MGEAHEVRLHAVDPDGVGIDVEERRAAELRHRPHRAAASAEQLCALVGDHDCRPLARRKMPLDLVGEVMHVDHRPFDAGFGEAVEHVVDQRLAADRHQGFRHRAVVRPHAGAEARRQHHGAAGCVAAQLRFPHRPPFPTNHHDFSAGTWRLYHSISSASDGCASDLWR